MRIVYIADDGTQFDNEYECEHYEWSLNHQNIYNIQMYDGDGNILVNFSSQDTYENADKVIVPDNAALEDLHELARLTGFCYYHQIESPGTWEFRMGGYDGRYIKTE